MEFTAKFDDQISPNAEPAAESVSKVNAEVQALDAKLRALDVAQRRAADSAEKKAQAFNPEAYKAQIKAEQELAAAKEKALEDLGMGLSKKEKEAEAEAAKKAAKEQADAARKEADAAKKATERQREKEKALEAAKAKTAQLATAARGAAMAMLAVGGAGGLKSLASIAVGYQGMARLQMISQRAELQFRQLFRGVDSRPLERAYIRLTQMFDKSTPGGRTLSAAFTGAFNSIFQTIEKAAPYVDAFAAGMIYAGYKAATAWVKLKMELIPLTVRLEGLIGHSDKMTLAFGAGAAALGLLGVRAGFAAYSLGAMAAKATLAAVASGAKLVTSLAGAGAAATGAAAPFVALAAAVGGALLAYDQWTKLEKEGGLGEAWRMLKEDLGFEKSDATKLNEKFEKELAGSKRVKMVDQLPPPGASAAPAAAAAGAPAGQKAGEAIGDGVVAGMKSREAAAAAGGAALAKAAEQGAKSAAEIRSPSRRMNREVGQQLGAGVVGGVQQSAPRVQQAAARSFVPSLQGGAGAAPGGGRSGASITIDLRGAVFGGGVSRAEVEAIMGDVAQSIAARLAVGI